MEIVVEVSFASLQLQGLNIFAAWCIPCYTLFYGFYQILNTEKKPENTSCGKFQSVKIWFFVFFFFSPITNHGEEKTPPNQVYY